MCRELVVMTKKNINGLSLIELLVVVAVIGVISIVAIPNTKRWVERNELQKDFYAATRMVENVRNAIVNGAYPMGGVFFDNNNGNGLIVKVRYRNSDKYRTYHDSCEDIDSQWDSTETISAQSDPNIYATFGNLRLSVSTAKACISKGFSADFSTAFRVCHKNQTNSTTCTPPSNLKGYEEYYFSINRTGYTFLRKYIYDNGKEISWENL